MLIYRWAFVRDVAGDEKVKVETLVTDSQGTEPLSIESHEVASAASYRSL